MAKKKTPKMNGATDYAQIQHNIQKAKGNPNKNIHHKKKNSNYAGYQNEEKIAQMQQEQEQQYKMPLGMKIALAITIGVMILMVFLLNGPLKGNQLASYITSVISGIGCLVVYYSQRWSPRKSTFQTVLGFILLAVAAIFIMMGGYGIYLTLKG